MSRGSNVLFVNATLFASRAGFVLAGFGLVLILLVGRAIQLQLLNNEFLESEGNARHLRVAEIPAHRGPITDRHGEPLAVSTPVDSVWANPQQLAANAERLPELAKTLGRKVEWLKSLVSRTQNKEFIYLRRHMNLLATNIDVPDMKHDDSPDMV